VARLLSWPAYRPNTLVYAVRADSAALIANPSLFPPLSFTEFVTQLNDLCGLPNTVYNRVTYPSFIYIHRPRQRQRHAVKRMDEAHVRITSFSVLVTHHVQPRRFGPILGLPSLLAALMSNALCAIASVTGHFGSGSGPFSIGLYL
jgi:hypothetical protein